MVKGKALLRRAGFFGLTGLDGVETLGISEKSAPPPMNSMLRQFSAFSWVLVCILSGCGTPSSFQTFSYGLGTEVAVTVSCSDESMRFTGTIVSDGRRGSFSGQGNATFHATGHEIVCSFKKATADGRISISVREAKNSLGTSSTSEPFGGVRAEVFRTPTRHNAFRERSKIFASSAESVGAQAARFT